MAAAIAAAMAATLGGKGEGRDSSDCRGGGSGNSSDHGNSSDSGNGRDGSDGRNGSDGGGSDGDQGNGIN